MITFNGNLSSCSTWEDAVSHVLYECISSGQCWSSGEVSYLLRTLRPDFVFSQRQVSALLNEKYDQTFYLNNVRVLRTTTGVGRTPAGVDVYVYGPSRIECENHDFEVTVPRIGTTTTALPPVSSILPPPSTEVCASVHEDGRLCIPARALAALKRDDGSALQDGDEVWVHWTPATQRIFVSPEPGGTGFSRVLSRGTRRVRFVAPEGLKFQKTSYPIKVSEDLLIIDLS